MESKDQRVSELIEQVCMTNARTQMKYLATGAEPKSLALL